MMTLNDLIKNNLPNDNSTYGDILNETEDIDSNLDPVNREIYHTIKQQDRQRILLNENNQLINNSGRLNRPANISGIGEVVQIC